MEGLQAGEAEALIIIDESGGPPLVVYAEGLDEQRRAALAAWAERALAVAAAT